MGLGARIVALMAAVSITGAAAVASGQRSVAAPGLAVEEERARRATTRWLPPGWKAGLTEVAALAGGTYWYWSNQDFNSPDWEYEWDWESWRDRLTGPGIRFDTNQFETNASSHTKAGALYYLLARGSGLGAYQSLAASFVTSTAWEYLIEYREKVSLNDVVSTPLAGMPFGEAFFQLGEFFGDSEPTVVNRTLATVFSPLDYEHHWGDRGHRWRGRTDRFGLTRRGWHRFALSAARTERLGEVPEPASTALAASTRIVRLPGYSHPGDLSILAGPGADTALDASVVYGDSRVRTLRIASRTSLGGWYAQQLERLPHGGLSGRMGHVAVGMGFEYLTRELPDLDTREQLGIVNVAGPTVEVVLRAGDLTLRAGAEAYLDVAFVRSAAYQGDDTPGDPGDATKAVLENQGYYYAAGATVAAHAAASYEGIELGVGGKTDQLVSIQGLDRHQERVVDDFQLYDGRNTYRTWAGYRPAEGPVELSLTLERRELDSVAKDDEDESAESRLSAGIALVL